METFNLVQALNGALVTVSGYEEVYTGRLKREGKDLSQFVVYMAGSRLVVSDQGKVLSCIPSLTGVTAGTTVLGIYEDTVDSDMTYKTEGGTRHTDSGYSETVELRSMQMRDHFAAVALGEILRRLDHPESANDSDVLHYSRVAYRWAAGMMDAALSSRLGVETPSGGQPSTETDLVTVDPDTLATNTEKLLYNIAATLDNIKLQAKSQFDDTHTSDGEVKVAVTDMTDIDINSMPDVVIDGTPDVNIANTPDVNVANTSSAPVPVSGTVSVDNFPQSSSNTNPQQT